MTETFDFVAKAQANLITFARAVKPNYQYPWHLQKLMKILERVEKGELTRVMIMFPPRHGKPCYEEELVLMGNGTYKKLKDISVGDWVIGHSKQPCMVSEIFLQGNLPCKKITTFSGRTITAAYDHPFLTPSGWVKTQNLEIHDSLALLPQASINNSKSHTLSDFIIAGYLIGDGHVTNTNNRQAANFTNADPEVVKDFIEHATNLGWKIKPGTKYHYGLSNGVRPWLRKNNIIGNSYTKQIPDWIFQGTSEQISGFIGAYFACDGSITKKHDRICKDGYNRKTLCLDLSSVNRSLLDGVQKLLLRLGVKCHIRLHTAKYKNKPYTSYRLYSTSHNDVAQFFRVVRIKGRKLVRLLEYDLKVQTFDTNYIADEIKSIENVSELPCRCLTVEIDHTFVINDFVVHNSETASVLFPTWFAGRNPDKEIMLVSGTQRLATRFGLKARNIISSDMYKNIFPHVELDPSSHAKTEFSFTSGGNAFYNSVGGQITGRGAHLFILDDLIPGAKEADSEVTMENLKDWYYEECYNRLMSDDVTPHGRIVLIGTRWRTNDIQGWLLDPEEQEEIDDWHIFRFPALAEEDEFDPDGKLIRREGDALWPDKYSAETLNKIRNKQTRVFTGAFQQKPTIETGNIVQRDWLNIEKVDESELIPPRILSLDTAFKEGTENDYSAGVVLQRTKTGVVVLFSEKRRMNFPSLIEWTKTLAKLYGVQGIIIEDKASGQSLIQTLRDKTRLPVVAIPVKRNEDKVSRLHAIVPYLESKRVTIHKFSPAGNRDALITELLEFPLGGHDDQVDAFVHGITYLLRPSTQLKRMGRKGLTPDIDIYSR